ncbi:MAG: hypoxanthine phosphoribosyltransferase [bacterium]
MAKPGRIRVHDKVFERSIEFHEIDAVIERMAGELEQDIGGRNPLFLAILNGAFMFAADLLKKIPFACEISFVKVASYTGTESTQTVRQLIGLDEDISGRTVVILEDIVDSGLTIRDVRSFLQEKNAGEVLIATLLHKPEAFRGDYPIDYVGMEIPNDFIVGYGLDYNRHGRNYRDIYKIVE